MDSYTITIAPNDDSGNSTTLVVDTSGDQVVITDVHLHAAGGLSGGTMPTVDFGLLLRAVGTSPSGQPRIETAPADIPAQAETAASPVDSTEPTSGSTEEPEPMKAFRSPRAKRTASTTAEPKRPRSRRNAAANAATPEQITDSTRRRGTTAAPTNRAATKKVAVKKAAVKKATAKKAAVKEAAVKEAAVKEAAAPTAGGGRAYRRMPDDFRAVYQQTSSPAAIADHYGVPRYTAHGWIRRIKAGN
jgi:hypothetical protein